MSSKFLWSEAINLGTHIQPYFGTLCQGAGCKKALGVMRLSHVVLTIDGNFMEIGTTTMGVPKFLTPHNMPMTIIVPDANMDHFFRM